MKLPVREKVRAGSLVFCKVQRCAGHEVVSPIAGADVIGGSRGIPPSGSEKAVGAIESNPLHTPTQGKGLNEGIRRTKPAEAQAELWQGRRSIRNRRLA